MSRKIEFVTDEEEAIVPALVDEWLNAVLKTGLADRTATQAAIADIYRNAGMEPPDVWIWLGSPGAGCIGAWMLNRIAIAEAQTANAAQTLVPDHLETDALDWVRAKLPDQPWVEMWAQARDQVRNQLQAQAERRIGPQLSDLVSFEISGQVRDQVKDQVEEWVWDWVCDDLPKPFLRQMDDLLWDHVRQQLKGQLSSTALNEAIDQAWKPRWDEAAVQILEQFGKGAAGPVSSIGRLISYDFIRRMKDLHVPECLEPEMRLAKSAVWFWPFAGACIMTERPAVLHRDAVMRLHCDNGPALSYPDGWAIHAWHGMRIPARFVEDKGFITRDTIAGEADAELQDVMLEILGARLEQSEIDLVAEEQAKSSPVPSESGPVLSPELSTVRAPRTDLDAAADWVVSVAGWRRREQLAGDGHLRAGAVFKDAPFGPEMVVVPPGRFLMGSPEDEPGRGADEGLREVTIGQAFAVGRYAVTFAEWDFAQADWAWRKFTGLDRCERGDEGWGRGNRPVVNVSWEDARAYAAWLSGKTGREYRLLTETEWEYAARAGTETPFWWGSSITRAQANYDGNFLYEGGEKGKKRGKTVPVDRFAPNPFGLYQVHGNVAEWVDTCLCGREGVLDDEEFFATRRVVRGGSWCDPPQRLRSAERSSLLRIDDQLCVYGFRVARTLNP